VHILWLLIINLNFFHNQANKIINKINELHFSMSQKILKNQLPLKWLALSHNFNY